MEKMNKFKKVLKDFIYIFIISVLSFFVFFKKSKEKKSIDNNNNLSKKDLEQLSTDKIKIDEQYKKEIMLVDKRTEEVKKRIIIKKKELEELLTEDSSKTKDMIENIVDGINYVD